MPITNLKNQLMPERVATRNALKDGRLAALTKGALATVVEADSSE